VGECARLPALWIIAYPDKIVEMSSLRVCILSLSLVLASSGLAQSSPAPRVDALIHEEMARQHIPGVAVGVVRNGEVVMAKGYGFANLELGAKVTPETVFKIASVSKQFIAAAVMLLVQDGKLGLDDPLAGFFEDAPNGWRRITLRHLLSHTSGFERELPGWDYLKTYSEAEIEAMARQGKIEFAPRERYQYSNTAYFLLGLVVSKVSGKPWADFMRKRVFEPLGMNATRATTWRDLVPNRASGYDWSGSGWTNDRALLSVRTSGAFLSSVTDLARWEAALVTNRVLTAASLRQMGAATRLAGGGSHPYGLGWNLEEYRGRRAMGHGGALLGFRSHYLRLLDDGLTVIVLANSSSANAGLLAQRLAAVWRPDLD